MLCCHHAGRICHALGPRPLAPCPFVRISFSLAPEAQLAEAMSRLGGVLRSFAAGQTPKLSAAPAAAAAEVAAAGAPVPPGAAAGLEKQSAFGPAGASAARR